jgi:hypothetical protein
MISMKPIFFASVLLGVSGIALTGCGGMNSAVAVVRPGVAMHGKAHGGQQPIVGATLQLYAVGSTGYGSAYPYAAGSTSLLNKVIQTDASGSFTINDDDYQCPSSPTEVYLVATGGDPGGAGTPANSSLAIMTALGPCESLNDLPYYKPGAYVEISELTTVASVWALAPFMTGIANVGASGNNAQGLINAFATANKLANMSTGTVSGPALPTGGSLPLTTVQTINTLADILAACVNSAGDTGPDSTCDMLFTTATVKGVKPADTITAAMNLAQNPNLGTSLTMLVPSRPPFSPTLSAVPADFSLVITYSGGGISKPSGIATDTGGNVWVANLGSNSVTELDAFGATTTDPTGFLSGATGYKMGSLSAPTAIALDQSGNAWVANGNNTVTEIGANGATGTLFNGGGINLPSGIAVDSSSNVWVANSGGGSSVTKITPGTTPTYANYSGSGISVPTAIAIDPK